MLYEEIKESLKNLEPDIKIIKEFWTKSDTEKEFKNLKEITTNEEFWKNPNQASILKNFQSIKNKRENYQNIINNYNEFLDMIDLFKEDEAELINLNKEIKKLKIDLQKFKVTILLDQKEDSSNCFLTINSGAGGTESQDWADMILRMYLRFCERENFNCSILDQQQGEEAGIKSATLFIKGENAYGILKNEHGVHRLVRISPFDANKRRHTSFASVFVTPEFEEVDIEIDPNDLRIDTYRAGGAGGQHVNKTDSAVRITHIPTGIVAQCQNERSQIQNKDRALKILKSRLQQKQKEEHDAKLASVEKKKIEWGSQIRSYVLHPYKMVKDHRTSFESSQPDNVLDGELMPFIESSLINLK